MTNLFIMLVIGIVLLVASLRLEAQTTYKGSVEYNKLKYIGGSGAILAILGFIILGVL